MNKEELKPFLFERTLNWYFNADNVVNQEAMFITKDFVEKDSYGIFELLPFLNLLFKQKEELKLFLETPIDFIEHLKSIPLNNPQRHLLLGMLIFWHGGIDTFDAKYKIILKLIEGEFLNLFPHEDTPIKCLLYENYSVERLAFSPTVKKSHIPDVDFIQGKRTEGFRTVIKPNSIKKVEHFFTVTKGEETREYSPFKFLDLVLDAHYVETDKTEDLNLKISAFVNAEIEIKRYIRENRLKELGYDFSKIFEDLNDVVKRLKDYKELGLIGNTPAPPQAATKLKWKGKPSQFGWLVFELAQKGYIDFPLYNGDINPTGLAKMCFELFDIGTTKENLIKEMNPNKNTFSDTKRKKFTIPNIEDIS